MDIGVAVLLVLLGVSVLLNVLQFMRHKQKTEWYNGILDAMPFPVSVTDNDMKWTFINKAVENMLSVRRADVVGKHCSSWGAGICNTDNCGVACLKRGMSSTRFEQMGMDFMVNVAYIKGESGKSFGHLEVVQDVSSMVKMEKAAIELVRDVSNSSSQIVNEAEQISRASQELADGTAKQASSIEELSETISNVAEETKNNSDRADKALKLSNEIKDHAEKSSTKMEQMVAAVREINEASHSIGKVIKVIDDIAFQTNILALNAAVEAARAGQHGKGFAVVAEEVRNLAAKSAAAANDTGALITNSIEKAEFGNRIAQETAQSLAGIASGINENSRIIGEIAKSSDQQTAAITNVNTGIAQVSAIVQNTAAISQENASTTREINDSTLELAASLEAFKRNQGIDDRPRLNA